MTNGPQLGGTAATLIAVAIFAIVALADVVTPLDVNPAVLQVVALVVVTLLLCIGLTVMVVLQQQEIRRNRETLGQMQAQAPIPCRVRNRQEHRQLQLPLDIHRPFD